MDSFKKILIAFGGVLAWTFLSVSAVWSQSNDQVFPPKPSPAVYVHDYSGWLSQEQKSALEYKLRRYWDSTSTQIVVMIRPDLGDYDRAGYAIELGNRWGIGSKAKNNGVVMLIKSEAPDRGIFIASGYGTEGGLTDLMAGRIVRNTMGPYFREKKYYEGINAGLDDIIQVLSGEFQRDTSSDSGGGAFAVIFFLVFLFIVIFVIIQMRRARKKGGEWYTRSGPTHDNNNFPGGGWWMGGGGFGGNSGWGGGGNSDSGGGWGGGGGDFGGGSFGGGGAGGDW